LQEKLELERKFEEMKQDFERQLTEKSKQIEKLMTDQPKPEVKRYETEIKKKNDTISELQQQIKLLQG